MKTKKNKNLENGVLLISPCSPDPPPIYYGPPYGLALIAAVLEKNKINPLCKDYERTSESEMLNDIQKIILNNPIKYIGISCQSSNRAYVYTLIQRIKELCLEIKIILGGPFAHQKYELFFSNFPVDYIIVEDGEYTFLELIKNLENGTEISSVKGIIYKKEGRIIKTEERTPIKNLDELPYPAFHFFNVEKKLKEHKNFIETESGRKKIKLLKGKRCTSIPSALMLLSSRGCIYSCSFCPMSKIKKNKYRYHSANYFVDMVEYFYKKYNQKYFVFGDNFFTLNQKRTKTICDEIIKRKLDIKWICMTRTDYVSQTLLDKMRRAGCIEISFGVESCSEDVQKRIGKNLPISSIRKAFKMCEKSGIRTILMLMVGNEGETKESIYETLSYIRDLEPDEVLVKTAKIYPGTKIHDIAEEKGIIPNDFYLGVDHNPLPFTAENPISELKKWKQMFELRDIQLATQDLCNNNCIHCSKTNKKIKTLEEIKRNILKVAKRCYTLTLCDKEPATRKDIFEIIEYCKEAGVHRLQLKTNARIFSYFDLAKKITNTDINKFIIPFFSIDKAAHEKITRTPGSFAQTLKGIKNLCYLNGKVQIEIRILNINYKHLNETIKKLLELGVKDFKLLYGPVKNVPIPEIKDLKNYLLKALETLKLNKSNFSIKGIPYCCIPQYEDNIEEIHRPFDEYLGFDDKLINIGKLRRKQKIKVDKCEYCKFDNICEGFWEDTRPFDYTKNTQQLQILLTRKCQFECEYCKMDRKKEDMSEKNLFKAIDLLFTSKEKKLELQFFGGEPLLRFDLIKKGIKYAEELSKKLNKEIKFLITTNGLFLDREKISFLSSHNTTIMFSIDGKKESQERKRKPMFKDDDYINKIFSNVRAVMASNCPYFVNMVVCPENVGNMLENFHHIVKKGIKNIQLVYEIGTYWDYEKRKRYIENLQSIVQFVTLKNKTSRSDICLFNLLAEEEPLLASPTIVIDTDGRIQRGCSIVLEKEFKHLQNRFKVGSLDEIRDLNNLYSTRKQQQEFILKSSKLLTEEEKIVQNNLKFGIEVIENISKMCGNDSYDNQALCFEIQLTHKCQLECKYCELDKNKPDMPEEILYKSIDFCFTTCKDKINIQFFGGEPLLRFDLIKKGADYIEKINNKLKKEITLDISTNALLLNKKIIKYCKNHGIGFIFSLDGDINTQTFNRPFGNKTSDYDYEKIIQNLTLLDKQGVKYFVNMVVMPENILNLENNFRYLVETLNVKSIKISYSIGRLWEDNEKKLYFETLEKILKEYSHKFNIENFTVHDEPTLASTSTVIDSDGKLYQGCVLSVFRTLPNLKSVTFLGDTNDVPDFDFINTDIKLQTKKIGNTSLLTSKEMKIIKNNLSLGLENNKFFTSYLAQKKKSVQRATSSIKKFLIKNKFYEGDILKSKRIFELYVMLSLNCTLRCKVCPWWGDFGACKNIDFMKKQTRNYLTCEELEKFAEDIEKFNPEMINFSGGEPLQAKMWYDLAKMLKLRGLKIILTTSGINLTENLGKICEVVDQIDISLSGPPSILNELRTAPPGHFEGMVQGLKKLTDYKEKNANKPTLRILCVISDLSYLHLNELVDYMEKEGIRVDNYSFQHVMFLDKNKLSEHKDYFEKSLGIETAAWDGYSYNPTGIDTVLLKKEISKLKSRGGHIQFFPDFKLEELDEYYHDGTYLPKRFDRFCLGPWIEPTLLPNGDIWVCHDFYIGNIKKQPFDLIWNGKEVTELRKHIIKKGLFPGCRGCFYTYIRDNQFSK